MLTEDGIREVDEVGFALLAPVLLSIFVGCSPFDNILTLVVDTRHRLVEGERDGDT